MVSVSSHLKFLAENIRPLILDASSEVSHTLISIVQFRKALFALYLNAAFALVVEAERQVILLDEGCQI